MYNPQEILAQNDISEYIGRYVKLKRDGKEFIGVCPFHNEKTPSFSVVPNKGFYHCFGCGSHGNLIDFVKNYNNVGFIEACQILGGERVANNEPIKKITVPEKEDIYKNFIIMPECKSLFPEDKEIELYNPKREKFQTYKPNSVYKYFKDNICVGYILRINVSNGRKILLPVQDCSYPTAPMGYKPVIIPFEKPRPIYGIETLKQKGNIFIVEGEKCVDAFRKISKDAQVISWIGGSKGIKYADWSQLPSNRDYILIPDADYKRDMATGELLSHDEQVGYKAMIEVYNHLPNPRTVRLVDTSSMGQKIDGWDIADALDEGWDLEKCLSFFKLNMKTLKAPEPEQKKKQKPEPEPEPEPTADYDDTYFKCMGYNGKNQYFYHRATGQVYGIKGSDLSSKSTLLTIAPLEWWNAVFPKETKGSTWYEVGNMLLRENEKIGLYDPDMVRKRGAYIDNGKAVLHVGNKVICEGKSYAPDRFPSKQIYMNCLPLGISMGKALSNKEASKFIDICRMARWEQPFFGDILAGWVFASLVCGVMPFRSHLYLIGAAGSGKSWVMDNIVKAAMGKMPMYCASKTTEAGIRKNLGGDVRPVIFNEAEAELQTDVQRMQAVFDLSRQASDEFAFAIMKGTGEGESYIIRSSFMFASINKSMSKYADLSRTAIIRLAVPPMKATPEQKKIDNDNFKALDEAATTILTHEYSKRLLARAVDLIPKMRKNHTVFANAAAIAFGSRRIGDTMAMPLTGLYSLEYDDYIDEETASDYIKSMDINTKKDDVEVSDQEQQALDRLMFSNFTFEDSSRRLRNMKLNVALDYLRKNNDSEIDFADRNKLWHFMCSNGLEYIDNKLYISTKRECFANFAFRGTLWESGWVEALRRLDNVILEKHHIFTDFIESSALVIPERLVFNKAYISPPTKTTEELFEQ